MVVPWEGGFMRWIVVFAVLVIGTPLSVAQTEDAVAVEETLSDEDYAAVVLEFMAELSPQAGEIALEGAPVMLSLPEDLIYYSSEDTKRVLEELWGNAPGYTQIGMIAPAGKSLGEVETWGAIISYDKTGYISDADARDIDYDELLSTMQKATLEESRENIKAGYPSLELRGWAAQPLYDPHTHRLFWAKELIFDGYTEDPTLNYNLRVLGRRGYLSINFVSAMSQLADIDRVAPSVLAAPQFNAGEAYTDYVRGDATADYGIAALVAGGAGVAALKKGGFLAVLLVFLKKGWFLVFAFGAAILSGVKRLFGGRS